MINQAQLDIESLRNETVFMHEIGRMASQSHNCGWIWQKKHADFPRQIGTRKGANHRYNPIYSKLAALAWLIRHGKIAPIDGIYPDEILFPSEITESIIGTPKIDNLAAQRFILNTRSKKHKKTTKPAAAQRIRTTGIWPIV